MTLKQELCEIANEIIEQSLPDAAVHRALNDIQPARGKTIIVSVGKAGWQMAKTTSQMLKGAFEVGFVITKYGHSKGDIDGFRIFEAGHPQIDQNGLDATRIVLDTVHTLTDADRVLLLLSGGGSALFEQPLISLAELQNINAQLLACGADIVEINTIRKRLSSVKGGKFAQLCAPAQVYSVILSDVVGDRVDMIASGPACEDQSTAKEAMNIVTKYKLRLSPEALSLMQAEPLSALDNAHSLVTGGVHQLCSAAVDACESRGYAATLLTDRLCCEAREAGTFLGCIAASHAHEGKKRAFIAGGETVVHLKGHGKGGRNQELALAAAQQISGLKNAAILSFGSDGTDGPTDAAGGVVDGWSCRELEAKGMCISRMLDDNDAYNALLACDGLLITGPTGTNVNDVSIVLLKE